MSVDDTDLLRNSLAKFLEDDANLNRVIGIISSRRRHPRSAPTNALSLRLLDFFVVNYVRDHAVVTSLEDGTPVDVYKSYQVTQERFRKKCFDPFARGGNVEEWCVNGKRFKSNVRQLCFMRWAIENKVLDYIEKHHGEIEEAMNKETVLKKSQPSRRRGCRTSASPEKYIVNRSRSKITIRLEFR